MEALGKLNSLSRDKRTAFLAFCASHGRHINLASIDGRDGRLRYPDFGKAECGWIDDPRDFWTRELPALGLVECEETEPKPALGMAPGSVCWRVEVSVTDEGRAAREAYWAKP